MSSNIKIQRICQHCGQEFTARTTVTQYCGDICAKRAYKARQKAGKIVASNNQTTAVKEKPLEEIKAREFLTIRDAATLLSCSRQTVYNLIRNGILQAVNLSERKTLINRAAIDKLFEKSQPTISPTTPTPVKPDIKDCYTLQALQNMYRLSQKALYELIKRHQIPKLKQGKFVYVPKAAIDQLLGLEGIQGSNNDTND